MLKEIRNQIRKHPIKGILKRMKEDNEVFDEQEAFKEALKDEDLLDVIFFLFNAVSAALLSKTIREDLEEEIDKEDSYENEPWHLSNRIKFLEEDVRKIKRKVKRL